MHLYIFPLPFDIYSGHSLERATYNSLDGNNIKLFLQTPGQKKLKKQEPAD